MKLIIGNHYSYFNDKFKYLGEVNETHHFYSYKDEMKYACELDNYHIFKEWRDNILQFPIVNKKNIQKKKSRR